MASTLRSPGSCRQSQLTTGNREDLSAGIVRVQKACKTEGRNRENRPQPLAVGNEKKGSLFWRQPLLQMLDAGWQFVYCTTTELGALKVTVRVMPWQSV
jgi:hypothetical protein